MLVSAFPEYHIHPPRIRRFTGIRVLVWELVSKSEDTEFQYLSTRVSPTRAIQRRDRVDPVGDSGWVRSACEVMELQFVLKEFRTISRAHIVKPIPLRWGSGYH